MTMLPPAGGYGMRQQVGFRPRADQAFGGLTVAPGQPQIVWGAMPAPSPVAYGGYGHAVGATPMGQAQYPAHANIAWPPQRRYHQANAPSQTFPFDFRPNYGGASANASPHAFGSVTATNSAPIAGENTCTAPSSTPLAAAEGFAANSSFGHAGDNASVTAPSTPIATAQGLQSAGVMGPSTPIATAPGEDENSGRRRRIGTVVRREGEEDGVRCVGNSAPSSPGKMGTMTLGNSAPSSGSGFGPRIEPPAPRDAVTPTARLVATPPPQPGPSVSTANLHPIAVSTDGASPKGNTDTPSISGYGKHAPVDEITGGDRMGGELAPVTRSTLCDWWPKPDDSVVCGPANSSDSTGAPHEKEHLSSLTTDAPSCTDISMPVAEQDASTTVAVPAADDSTNVTLATAPPSTTAAVVAPSVVVVTEDTLLDAVLQQRELTVMRSAGQGGVVGKGGFGVVYKARTAMGEDAAVKLMQGVSVLGNLAYTELQVLQLLQHPSIVRFIDAFAYAERDWTFIVMEFVEGGDLLHALTNTPQVFDEARLRPMMFHIACGLGYAHERGVMHRDIKPENILLTGDYFPKVTDFGLARVVSQSEVLQTVVGTPGYIAPEINDPRTPYDFPADVFSLGLVFAGMIDHDSALPIDLPPAYAGHEQRFLKRWPTGAEHLQISSSLLKLQQNMTRQAPGERVSFYKLCLDLVQLAQDDPALHPLWEVPTAMPNGPPPRKMVTQEDAAEIAGRGGYAVGVAVQVQIDGAWYPGRVHKISTTLCPGALQVHFKDNGTEKAVLVCPWQFPDLLRPVSEDNTKPPELPTMVFALDAGETEVLPQPKKANSTKSSAKGGGSADKLAKFLSEHGYAGVNAKRTKLMWSKFPLHTAVKQKNDEMVQLLLQARADPSCKNSAGLTPQQLAQQNNARGSHDAVLSVFASLSS